MSPMATKILDLVKKDRNVSFVELQNRIKGFGGGDLQLVLNTDKVSNIVLWVGLTSEGADALEELRVARAIHPAPAHWLSYMHDGQVLKLPLAKAKRHYKKPHWLPTVFNPGPDPDRGGPDAV